LSISTSRQCKDGQTREPVTSLARPRNSDRLPDLPLIPSTVRQPGASDAFIAMRLSASVVGVRGPLVALVGG
jgi:hypothetical protein